MRRAVLRREIGVLSKSEVHLSDIVSALPLGQGEIEAFQVGLDGATDVVILDDQLARQHGAHLGLTAKGTIGVLVDAYRGQLLTLEEVTAVFETIASRDDIWISEGLLRQVLEQLQRELTRDV